VIISPTKVPVFLLLTFILLVNVLSVWHLSATYDEGRHLQYGRNLLNLDPRRSEPFYDSKMPFSALNAVPSLIGQRLSKWMGVKSGFCSFLQGWFAARFITILFSMLLAFYVYRWSRELYGPYAGLLSLFLYAFSPNIIAHSQLVTTDLYLACMTTLAVYYFWKFMRTPNRKTAVLSAGTLGLAQLAKYTAVFLYPIFLILTLLSHLPDRSSCCWTKDPWRLFRGVGTGLKYAVFFALTSLLLINAGFVGYRTFTPLKEYEFQSRLFQGIQATRLGDWPVPVPAPYLQGLDMVRNHDQTGDTFGGLYLRGELRTRTDGQIQGFPGYTTVRLKYCRPA